MLNRTCFYYKIQAEINNVCCLRVAKKLQRYVKTHIINFRLDLAVKARMIEHAFKGRFRDEVD